MASGATILVATSDTERADALVAAAHAGGFDPLSAAAVETVLRAAVGSDPDVIVIDGRMPGLEGFALHERLSRTGLELPPIVVLAVDGAEVPRVAPPHGVYVLSGPDTSTDAVIGAVRLILLAEDIEGELAGSMKLLHGDLVRSPFVDLVRALRHHRMTGTVTVHGAQISGFTVQGGVPVDAWRGVVRGPKALCRLAGLPSGAFSLAPGRSSDERTIESDPEALLEIAARDRRDLRENLSKLPSLDAYVDVNLTSDFFSQVFEPIERKVLGTAHEASSLRALLDLVDALDGEVARTVVELRERNLLRVSERTGRVYVVTDASCDLPVSEARRLAIEVVGITEDDAPALASGASSAAMAEAFRRLAETGDVLAVMTSSRLSDAYRDAVDAANRIGGVKRAMRSGGATIEPRVLVVDSRQLSGPLGMTAILATRLLATGIGLEAAARRVADLGRRWRTVLLLPSIDAVAPDQMPAETFRDSGAAPDRRWIVVLEEGLFRIEDSTDVASARAALVDRLLGTVDRGRPVFVGLFHDSAPAEIAAIRTMLRARLRIAEMWESQMGSATVGLTGKVAVGAAILQPDADELDILTERG